MLKFAVATRFACLFLVLTIGIVLSPLTQPLLAQEGTATATATESPAFPPTWTETPTAVPTDIPTATMTASATSSPTATFTDTSTPDAGQTASPTATIIETPTETATSDFLTPSPSSTATETATQPAYPAEPPLTQLFTDNFDTGALYLWTLGNGWGLVPSESGQALQVTNNEEPVTFVHNNLGNVAAQVRFQFNTGMARLSLRQSDAGSYTVLMDVNGQVAVYRGSQVIGSTTIGSNIPDQWRTMRVSVIDNLVRVSVDGTEALIVQDDIPLPPGTLSFAGIGIGEDALRVDDFGLWIPTGELVTPTPTETATATATLPSESQLSLIFDDSFSTGSTVKWGIHQTGTIIQNGSDYAMACFNCFGLHPNISQNLFNVAAESEIRVYNGLAQIQVRGSSAGNYTASIDSNGQIQLLRSGTLVQSATTSVISIWHTLHLSAIENVIRVSVDGTEVITWIDDNPLPAGQIRFVSQPVRRSSFVIDDVQIWTATEENSSAAMALREMAAPMMNTQSLPSDFGEKFIVTWAVDVNLRGIYSMNTDGSDLQLLSDPTSDNLNGIVSPDGTQIAFTSLRDGNAEIYVMNSDGTNPVRLTENTESDEEPSWSPDGNKIVFRRLTSIFVINADGTNEQQLTDSITIPEYGPEVIAAGVLGLHNPVWSPSGDWIVYEANIGYVFDDISYVSNEILRINPSGSGVTSLTHNVSSAGQPNWSHQSDTVAYFQMDSVTPDYFWVTNYYNIYLMQSDGSGKVPLTTVNGV